MKNEIEIVRTRNNLLLGETLAQLLACRLESSRFAIVQGPAGTGKTTTAKAFAKQFRGLYFSVRELESPRSLFVGLLELMNEWTEELRLDALHHRLIYALAHKGWPPIFFDEADRLDKVRNGVSLLEVVRDVHDRAPCAATRECDRRRLSGGVFVASCGQCSIRARIARRCRAARGTSGRGCEVRR
jgi:SpoVK/Ycf46/Vps4 family AAA+-type ATPase